LKSKSLTIQVVVKLRLAVFTWHGFTPSEVFKEGTIRSLEILRDHPTVDRIILNARDHSVVMYDDIEASVKSTVDYLGIAQGSYRMAVVPPEDLLAKGTINLYIDSLNKALKKRFVVRQLENTKAAFSWLTKPKILSALGI
jgi:hypothetical protein